MSQPATRVPFNDLRPLHRELASELANALDRVVRSGQLILGPEVEAFESELASYVGAKHVVGVASGTDAIELCLRAAGIGFGDEIITVANGPVPTVAAIERAGATPKLVDVDPGSRTIDPDCVTAAIGPRTSAIVAVHLYGQPASLRALRDVADRHHLWLIEDCAQALGASIEGSNVGTWGDAAAISFYPTKNLGALGDGGAVLTSQVDIAQRVRRLRTYGEGDRRHWSLERGINSRLDELQAAFLRVKLRTLETVLADRRDKVAAYRRSLVGVELPDEVPGTVHANHLYVIELNRRDEVKDALARAGIQTMIHYPFPVHLQPAYAYLGLGSDSLPVTERLAKRVLSLPLYWGMDEHAIDLVTRHLTAAQVENG